MYLSGDFLKYRLFIKYVPVGRFSKVKVVHLLIMYLLGDFLRQIIVGFHVRNFFL